MRTCLTKLRFGLRLVEPSPTGMVGSYAPNSLARSRRVCEPAPVPTDSFGSLGALSRAQLQAAVDRFDLGRVQRAWPLTEGLFGRNVAIDTSNGGWVLRGDPWPVASDYQFRKEAFFAQAIHERCGVPAPWPYHVESDAGILPWPYALMPRLDGQGVDLSDPGLDWMAVAEALGAALAELHRITWPHPGEWTPDHGMTRFDGAPSEWLEARLAAWLFMLYSSLDSESETLVLSNLERAQAELGGDGIEVTYIHHDFKATNLSLGRSDDGPMEVVGVFDLNEGYAADPFEDLPRCLWDLASRRGPAVGARFLSSYAAASGRALSAPRVLAYTVFDLLIIWEFGSRPAQSWFGPDATFTTWSAPLRQSVSSALELL